MDFPSDRVCAPGPKKRGQPNVEPLRQRLDMVVKEWNDADPTTPVQPALHVIASVAQADSGRDGTYRARIDSANLPAWHESGMQGRRSHVRIRHHITTSARGATL